MTERRPAGYPKLKNYKSQMEKVLFSLLEEWKEKNRKQKNNAT